MGLTKYATATGFEILNNSKYDCLNFKLDGALRFVYKDGRVTSIPAANDKVLDLTYKWGISNNCVRIDEQPNKIIINNLQISTAHNTIAIMPVSFSFEICKMGNGYVFNRCKTLDFLCLSCRTYFNVNGFILSALNIWDNDILKILKAAEAFNRECPPYVFFLAEYQNILPIVDKLQEFPNFVNYLNSTEFNEDFDSVEDICQGLGIDMDLCKALEKANQFPCDIKKIFWNWSSFDYGLKSRFISAIDKDALFYMSKLNQLNDIIRKEPERTNEIYKFIDENVFTFGLSILDTYLDTYNARPNCNISIMENNVYSFEKSLEPMELCMERKQLVQKLVAEHRVIEAMSLLKYKGKLQAKEKIALNIK